MIKFLVLIFFMFSFTFSQEESIVQKKDFSSAKTSIDNTGRLVTELTNKKYDLISVYNNKNFDRLLLDETIYHKIVPGQEGRITKVNIIAWALDDKNIFNKKIWEINDIGYEVDTYWDYIKLIIYGCCGSDDSFIFYHKDTGKKYLTSTSDFAFFNVPNTRNRRVSTFHSSNAHTSQLFRGKYKFPLGILYYASREEVKYEILVAGKLNDLHGTPKMSFKDDKQESSNLTLWSANGNSDLKAISGLSLIMDFDFFKIEIPIVEDHLDLDNAVLPSEYVIKLIPYGNNKIDYLKEDRFKKLEKLSKAELRILRNEIFARHGHSFKSDDLKEYFSSKIWYQEIIGYKVNREELSSKELEMIDSIRKLEDN